MELPGLPVCPVDWGWLFRRLGPRRGSREPQQLAIWSVGTVMDWKCHQPEA